MRPYEPVAFQFSHHVLEQDGTVRHVGEFLSVQPGVFPNYDFARALKKELEGDEGSVFMWSHHENTILSKIIDQLHKDPNPPVDAAELIDFLRILIKGGDREMIDLCALAEKSFYHPDTKGSNSIKKVLPAILKISPILRETYSQPVYGAPDGIASLNYSSPEGFTWLRIDAQGNVADPYEYENDASYPLLLNYGNFTYSDLEFYLDNEHIFNLPAGRLMEICNDANHGGRFKEFPLEEFGSFVIENRQLRIPEFTLEITEPFEFFKFRYEIDLTKIGQELYSSPRLYYGDKQFTLYDLGHYVHTSYNYYDVKNDVWVCADDDDLEDEDS